MKDATSFFFWAFFWMASVGMVIWPYVVHIIRCVKTDWVAMLLLGLFIPPVGWVHGAGIILGVWG